MSGKVSGKCPRCQHRCQHRCQRNCPANVSTDVRKNVSLKRGEPAIREGGERNQLLGKIAQIMDYVTRADYTQQSMQQMARELDIPRPTLYRLLDALMSEGVLVQVDSAYYPGPRMLGWAVDALNRPEIGRMARPVLQQLAKESGVTASVHVRMGHTRVCVDRVEESSIVRPHVRVGESLPLHLGASGKILLAFIPDDIRKTLIQQSCVAFAGHDAQVTAVADDVLSAVRRQGWALSLGERDEALASLSAPVMGPQGEVVAAISLSGVRQRFTDDKVTQWRTRVVDAATDVSLLLGGRANSQSASSGN